MRPNLKATMTMRSINKMLDEYHLGARSGPETLDKLEGFLDNKGLRFPVVEQPKP
jgi:hypothetical protein